MTNREIEEYVYACMDLRKDPLYLNKNEVLFLNSVKREKKSCDTGLFCSPISSPCHGQSWV